MYFCVSETDYYEYLCQDRKRIGIFQKEKERFIKKNGEDSYEDDYLNIYLDNLTPQERYENRDYLEKGLYSILKYRTDDEDEWCIKIYNTSSPLAMWLCGIEIVESDEE